MDHVELKLGREAVLQITSASMCEKMKWTQYLFLVEWTQVAPNVGLH